METRKIPAREDVAAQDKWAIEDLFATDDAWREALAAAKEFIPRVTAFRGRDQHRDREHDVDRAQTDVSDHVGHKKSVRDAVQRGQDHHGDARERKTKQTAEGKVV